MILRTITLVAVLMFFTNTNTNAQEPYYFKIHGKVHPASGGRAPSKINVYQGNDLAERIDVSRRGKFKVWVKSDQFYTLEVTMENHVRKLVTVSTEGVSEVGIGPDQSDFDFDIYLYAQKDFEGKNKDLMDYPAAWIYYDKEYRKLAVNKLYTRSVYYDQKELAETDGETEEFIANN